MEKLTRREKRYQILREKYLNPEDIKYRGPITYRYLRIIAWVAFALGYFLMITALGNRLLGVNVLSEGGENFASIIASLSTPLFIIAAFGYVLGGHKTYKNLVIFYSIAFVAIGAAVDILYARYIASIFVKAGTPPETLVTVGNFFKHKVEINVFADLASFALVCFFLNCNPKKSFKGKKIILFRLFAILPILFVFSSYILKVISAVTPFELPFYAYPFLTTKSPYVFLAFVAMALWLKYREKLFLKIGLTKEQYREYLKTNRNSLSFSTILSIIILVAAFVDFVVLIGFIVGFKDMAQADPDGFSNLVKGFNVGQALSMILVIPFVMLFSYTRGHKDKNTDLFVVLGGIGLTVIMVLESVYQLLIRLLA